MRYTLQTLTSMWIVEQIVRCKTTRALILLIGLPYIDESKYFSSFFSSSTSIILGAFFLGLAFLSYKGWINANWKVIQNQTYSGMMNASQAAQQYIQSTMQHMSAHPAMLQGQGITIAAGLGFIPGIMFGLRK